jgi:hypothetical protein
VVKVETDDAVVGGQGELVEPGVDGCGDPLVAAAQVRAEQVWSAMRW